MKTNKMKKQQKVKDVFKIVQAKDLSTLSTLFASGCHRGMQDSPVRG
jgi:hypothetical protein